MNWLTNKLKSFRRGLSELSPSCKHAARLQSEALDRPLTLRQRFGLRFHLLLCKWCRRYGKQIRFLHDTAREHPDELTNSASCGLSPEARERLKRSIESANK